MASNEAQFQTELLHELRQINAHAFKVSERFGSGVADLFIKHADFPAIWLELKFAHAKKNGTVPVELTPLQRLFLARELNANGYAGWAVCTKGARSWSLFVGSDPRCESVHVGDVRFFRGVGGTWNVRAILQEIVDESTKRHTFRARPAVQ